MNNGAILHDPLHATLARLIMDTLGLSPSRASELEPDFALVGGKLGLTDLDILEVAVCVEERFEVTFGNDASSKRALTNIASLASFIRRQAPVSMVASLPALDVEFDETQVSQPDWFRV